MTEEAQGSETTAGEVIKRRVRRKKQRPHRRQSWRNRLRVVFSSNILFYLLTAAVLGGVVALFAAAIDSGRVIR
ncbi:hypothetical protein AMK68_02720 [candidate division KD3-62 bacterium DG_56]|uniref:Uncharacterized protein n=1 Tax=candidate division KD3-62 bacterium DG_56 TaxID=1704032 RepID=A0A0S7XNM1_9BACT|nr:MAG: hypothetical protein AMK68_02720 [candidate division KD3-62 bacterium DG_56]